MKEQTISKYLKPIIRNYDQNPNKWFSTKFFAEKFNVHPSTVTEHFQSLSMLGLVEYKKYKGIKLTPHGIKQGQILMRKHRILEYFFSNELGLTCEEACKEASKIDIYISEKIIDKICTKLEHPRVCPCGHNIFHY